MHPAGHGGDIIPTTTGERQPLNVGKRFGPEHFFPTVRDAVKAYVRFETRL
jgi:hypothetical protein